MKKPQSNNSPRNSTNKSNTTSQDAPKQQFKKISEYGRQLADKQKVKNMYGLREKQFKIFFKRAQNVKEATGKALLSLLELRLDNIIYRLKLASTRLQARQLVVHGHFNVNNKRVFTPSITLRVNDTISLSEKSKNNEKITKELFDKTLSTGLKVPEWLELNKDIYFGRVLRAPVREDIHATINENSIVELYSKS